MKSIENATRYNRFTAGVLAAAAAFGALAITGCGSEDSEASSDTDRVRITTYNYFENGTRMATTHVEGTSGIFPTRSYDVNYQQYCENHTLISLTRESTGRAAQGYVFGKLIQLEAVECADNRLTQSDEALKGVIFPPEGTPEKCLKNGNRQLTQTSLNPGNLLDTYRLEDNTTNFFDAVKDRTCLTQTK